ncbi:MAG: zinc ribbon domain-containing protein [archaeon]|nr:zinc ribbon domain-containing protein [archaeon]
MVKQCPRCWDKVSPEDTKCPNCGFDLIRKTAPSAQKVAVEKEVPVEEKRRVAFPTPRKKGDREGGITLRLAEVLTIVWGVLAVLGGVWNLATGNLIQGAGFLASGFISCVAFMFIRNRERCLIASLIVIISGAASLNIGLLIISVVISFLVYSNLQYFKSK